MYFMALAVDYDGTLADEGIVSSQTIDALIKLKSSGRKLIMVTGRQLEELLQIFDRLDLFDRIVAENGALLYTPQTQVQRLLAEAPSEEFISKLKIAGIPFRTGKVIVATEEPYEAKALEAIRDMGLELQIIFNKGSVMILPSSINKSTGLMVALKELGLSMHNIVGIGDAENDHAFLRKVGLGVAVANAYEEVKQTARMVTKSPSGQGVIELIGQLLENEELLISKVEHKIVLGVDEKGSSVELNPIDRVLIAGNSGIGKSTLATALTEKMVVEEYQFCIFDPEGDYEQLENAIGVGEIHSSPSLKQVIELLEDPSHNVVVNTLGVELSQRPAFFVDLALKLVSLKADTARPHWLIMDEAHHLMPAAQGSTSVGLPKEGTILITVHPEEIALDALKMLNVILILGPQALSILEKVSKIIGEPLPQISMKAPVEEELLMWQRGSNSILTIVKPSKPKQQHKRHTRKYAIGDLSEEFSFYFRGPKQLLNLKAQNLMIFLQIAEGIDEETWMYHLKNNDYSDWFKVHIKDAILAESAARIENDPGLSAIESKQAISKLVKELYTAPASSKE